MTLCDERCIHFCDWYDRDTGGCGYRTKTDRPRGVLTEKKNGWKSYVYPDPCDKFKPRDGLRYTPHTLNIESAAVKTIPEKRNKRPLREYPERTALYEKGLTDREIASELGVSLTVIQNWRYNRGLAPNSARPGFPDREELYSQGLSDREIAERVGVSCSTIINWRNRRGLTPHVGPRKKIEPKQHPNRTRLYEQGKTDEEIARAENVTRAAISGWRRKNGLPPNQKKGK